MIRINLLLFFLLLNSMATVPSCFAQDSIAIAPYTKKQSSTLSFLEYKYQTGAYEEILKIAPKYLKKAEAMPLYYQAQLLSIQALSYSSLLHEKKAAQLINDFQEKIVSCQYKKHAILSWLSLARYFEETKDFVKVSSILKTCDSLAGFTNNKLIQHDLLWHKSLLAFQTGFYNEALENSNRLEADFYLNGLQDTSDFKRFSEEKSERWYQATIKTEILSLKALSYAYKGMYVQADSILKLSEEKSIVSTMDIFQRTKLMNVRAEIMVLKKNYNASADFYKQAYSVPEVLEREKGKLLDLVYAIEGFYRTGRSIESQSYLRRLQMLAYQSIGKVEDFQIAYEYTESFRLFSEGNERAAEKRLTNILMQYSDLSEMHTLKFKTRLLLSELYEKTGNIAKLLENETTIAFILEKYYGKRSIVYHRSKLRLALFEIKYGKKFEFAGGVMKESYDGIVRNEIDPLSPENIQYLNAYADLYKKTDRLDSSAYRLSLVVDICRKNYGEQSGPYLLALANYSESLIAFGKYKEGLERLQFLITSANKWKVEDLEIQQRIYLVLGKLNKLLGEYDLSKSMFDKALSLDYRSKYNDFLLQAETAEQMASLYFQTNNFYKAERALNKAYSLKKENLPEGNPLFYNPINSFAALKLHTGNLDAVEQYLNQATAISEEVYGKKSLMGIDTKILYGDFNYSIGDYKKAESIYLEADQLVISKLGTKHLKHAEILLQLISVRMKIASFKKTDIEKIYSEAIEVVKNALGTNNPFYMEIIQNQARYFITMNKTTEAEKLITEVEKYWKTKLGTENRHIAIVYELRGDIAYVLSKYGEAEIQFGKSKEVFKSVFSDHHPDYNNVYAKMARALYMNKNIDKAINIMDDIIPKYLDFTLKYFPSLSFRQKQEYWKSIRDEFEFYNTLAFNSKKVDKEMWAKAYNNTLSTKAILLSSGVKLLNQVMNSNDTVLIALYNDWIGKKEYLLTILSMTKQQLIEQGIDRNQLEDDISRIEKEMSTRSSLFVDDDKKKKLITWENVKEALQEGEYAVEIVRYRYFNKTFTDSVYYAAFVINRGSSKPYVVVNNNGINMEHRNLRYYRNATITKATDEFSYKVYWENIKTVIPDGSVVYFSGDGVYNQLNVEMLRHDEGLFAIDENKFVFMSNTKDLLSTSVSVNRKQKESKKENTIDFLLCGSPDFYSMDTKIENRNIPELPGTEKEIQLVSELLVSNGKQPLVFYKASLTEDTLKEIKNPRVLHVATHGYFKESNALEEEELSNSPLLNSGILLYASGDILDNPDNKYINQKSGVLTAYEAMNLTLDNTELVILSACETGRGEVQVGEGVAGLQRAFLLAGSKAIVVSLFKVSDEVTQKLMLSFYEKWLKTGDKRKAFSDAKKEIKQQYPDPIYWGAFMMIEGRPARSSNLKTN